jgi:bifunctional non-homologous end joining protein LigD
VLRKNPFIPPCLPTLRNEPPIGPGWTHEVKFDGYRLQIHKEAKNVSLYSKTGNDFTSRFPEITYVLTYLPTKAVILDAELIACRDDWTPDFSALLHRQDTQLCVWVFDILAQNGKDVRSLTLRQRRAKLDKLMARTDIATVKYSETFDDPNVLFKACTDRRLEGIVSKRIDRPYRSGPSKDWLKVKCAHWREANTWRQDFFESVRTDKVTLLTIGSMRPASAASESNRASGM